MPDPDQAPTRPGSLVTLPRAPHRRHARPIVRALAVAFPLFIAAQAFAQGTGPTWITLDGQPEGTPASVLLNTDLSGPFQTTFDVFISGFYVATRVGDDGRTYQDLTVPGLPSYPVPGEPRVPIVRADLAMVTDSPGAVLTQVNAFDLRALPGYLVWPSPIPALLHDGTPSQFVRDEATYTSAVDFPAEDGHGAATRATMGGIPASLVTAYPVHWNPGSGTLTVGAHVRYTFSHGGGLLTPMDLTVEHANAASAALLNWGSVGSNVSVNWQQFNGAYLIVCPKEWLADLQKFIQEKKTRGFSVSIVIVPLNGETCLQLRQAIQTWYAGTPSGFDHYCLLVGSTGSTPYCCNGVGLSCNQMSQLSDKVLSSVDGDGEPEIYLGRLWVSNVGELQNQVKKILDYETGPQVNFDQNALLVAHKQQNQDFDFQKYSETIRQSLYAQVTPNFITCYGTDPTVGNLQITNNINTGVGVVNYIGHGFPQRWSDWSFWGASFTHSDALALTNDPRNPVVWSLACQTGDPRDALSLASGFMKNTQGGAVAFYGAVDQTFGDVTSVLDDSLFQAVYGRGITRHGLALAYGEHAALVADTLTGFDAAYKYMLYGDPDMGIKRKNSTVWAPIDLITPVSFVTPCPGIDCCPSCPAPVVDIQARSSSGAPIAGVKVGLWKASMSGTDEVLANRYTGPDGWAHIPAPGLTAGTLYVGFDDGDGRAGMDSIDVESEVTGVSTVVARPGPLRLTVSPNVTSGTARFSFGRPLDGTARLGIFSVNGRLVRAWSVASGAESATWDGRDQAGRPAATGLYVARLKRGPALALARVLVVR